MYSLAGPGAYTIPSTFCRRLPNVLLRVVQRESYGREFARQKRILTSTSEGDPTLGSQCQRCTASTVDTHRHYAFTPPLTYQHYLMTTSYLGRLKKHQRQRVANQ
ncbi:hypothetical protein JM18_009695 [Phytophthora kernoviae]|uniref:Uncharacterized protein n=2 Tax=Phytophthora kernoviae TaxID=325452 RepID=A0A8T0LJZ7_9STRA|nr:hypothetical protein G195_011433 [Phytophthora kernoviae 00238/432]KAG2502317.1 hypothetical protein JM16_009750 [Phytophthora kernoviae]KAG2502436.1 hypothetical protein JM18_009695 [Phytophthora kernoviae]